MTGQSTPDRDTAAPAVRVEGEGLLERGGELGCLASVIDGVRAGWGRLVVVEGAAGIGKTALLAAARELAVRAGLAVFDARGSELEVEFGYGVVRQLFERRVGETDRDAFEGPAVLAASLLGVTLDSDGNGAPGPEEATFAVMHGLYWLTGNLARSSPVALILDDGHWADAASLRFLGYLAGRLERLGVLVLVATRPPGEPSGAAGAVALGQAPGALVLRPAPLSEQATGRLVRNAVPDASEELCRECRAVTGGNPFFVGELAGTLRGAGAIAEKDVSDLVPANVTEAVAVRIARLPDPVRELARATALLGGSEVALRYAALLAGLSAGEAAAAADSLAAGGLMLARLPLSFVHPIVRAAVYGEIPAGRRADAHARAARLLAAEDAPPERVAAHLLATQPAGDAWTVERLVQAADQALARGAPEAAINALRRALQEPPAPSERPELLIALGTAEMLALDTEPAVEHLRRGIETASDPATRLRAAMLLAALFMSLRGPGEAVDVLERALAHAEGADPALVAHVESQLVNIARLEPDTRRRAARHAARLRARVDSDAQVGAQELAAVACDMAQSGESAQRTAELALRGVDRLRGQRPSLGDFSVYFISRCLLTTDLLDEALEMLDSLLEAARARGADFEVMPLLGFRAEVLVRRGELARAELDARAGLELAGEGWNTGGTAIASALAAILLEYGNLEEAREVLDQAGIAGPAGALPATYFVAKGVHIRGQVRLAAGEPQGAAEDLLECGRRLHDAGEPNPAYIDWRSCAALALARLGDHDRARQLVEEELTLARKFGAPRPIALALRARAALSKAEEGLDDLRKAAGILNRSPAQLALAHVLGDLGVTLLQCRQQTEALETLRDAAELAERCGATALTEKVLADLRSTGARPRRTARTGTEALTPAQRRVADLASQGLPNREIAGRLHVTPRTVEYHLSATYRKLGIRARAELEAALTSTSRG